MTVLEAVLVLEPPHLQRQQLALGGAVFHASAPTPIAAGLYTGPDWTSYGVHPDGRRFLALPPRTQFGSELRQINYSDDWLLRARRLLARGGSS